MYLYLANSDLFITHTFADPFNFIIYALPDAYVA